ncbi:MAG: phosphotransferase, partial [Solobacterium sp.]|nr:phosphotransferase [Solobacterium sp.]
RIINRRNEKKSLILAKQYGIDPTYIYMDVNEGWKISKFITDFREPDYSSFEDSKIILEVLRRLHSLPITVDYGMKPWEDALKMENLLKEKDPDCFNEYEDLKERIRKLYSLTVDDGIQPCFCHGDTYRPNWMIQPDGNAILIDWEYSGFSDPGIDVGYYIVDAMYDIETARQFIREYLQDNYTKDHEFHFMAYTAIIAYYWFVWALYRESCGAVMGEALQNWHVISEQYSTYLLERVHIK